MTTAILVSLFLSCPPSEAQPSVATEDTLWVQPFIASLKIVLSETECVDFIVLDSIVAEYVGDAYEGIPVVCNLPDVVQNMGNDEYRCYVRLNFLSPGFPSVQLQWSNVSIAYASPGDLFSTTHVNYSFYYWHNGIEWTRQMSSIVHIEHQTQEEQ